MILYPWRFNLPFNLQFDEGKKSFISTTTELHEIENVRNEIFFARVLKARVANSLLCLILVSDINCCGNGAVSTFSMEVICNETRAQDVCEKSSY